jgi:hypothetical protein
MEFKRDSRIFLRGGVSEDGEKVDGRWVSLKDRLRGLLVDEFEANGEEFDAEEFERKFASDTWQSLCFGRQVLPRYGR